jgi:hypothetical protein
MERIVMKVIAVTATSATLYLLLTNGEGTKNLFNGVGALSTNFANALNGRAGGGFVKA